MRVQKMVVVDGDGAPLGCGNDDARALAASVDTSPGGDCGNSEDFQVFELLALTTKPVVEKTYPVKAKAGLFEVSIEPLNMWCAEEQEPSRRVDC